MKDAYLKKDEISGAILNTDNSGLARYRESKNKFRLMTNHINNLEVRLTRLEEKIK